MKLRFPYQLAAPNAPATSLTPRLSITLSRNGLTIQAVGLLDSGATINVLPFDLGLQLGARWSEQSTIVQLAGNLSKHDARGIVLMAEVAKFDPVPLVFAWVHSNDAPLILGQVNFFTEFDVCFFRRDAAFELTQPERAT